MVTTPDVLAEWHAPSCFETRAVLAVEVNRLRRIEEAAIDLLNCKRPTKGDWQILRSALSQERPEGFPEGVLKLGTKGIE